MKLVKVEDAIGHVLCHDITQIIKDVKKGVAFKKGHVVQAEDIEVLLSIGKEHLYIWEHNENMLHEDEAAQILIEACENQYMQRSDVSEGKIELRSTIDGVFVVDTKRLKEINMLEDMMIATRHNYDAVRASSKLLGTRIIPLLIEKERMEAVKQIASVDNPICRVEPYKVKKVGIVTTGSEVYHGRIQDTFTPVIKDKLKAFDVEVVFHRVVDDVTEDIVKAIEEAKASGVDMILCTGGMSVDPDDLTPAAIKASGARIISYGAPVLPGAMFLLGYFDDSTPIAGLPGCAMYSKATIFDIVLPRLLAKIEIKKSDLADLGEGGLCLQCETCTFPNCGFGK